MEVEGWSFFMASLARSFEKFSKGFSQRRDWTRYAGGNKLLPKKKKPDFKKP